MTDGVVIWTRVGDEDGYHEHDGIEEAAAFLWELGIQAVERGPEMGVTAPGYEGYNYISIFWDSPKAGEEGAIDQKPLADNEIDELNESLESIADCPDDEDLGFCDGCEAKAVENVQVSEDSAHDDTRNYCASCLDVYYVGVQHGRHHEAARRGEKPGRDSSQEHPANKVKS